MDLLKPKITLQKLQETIRQWFHNPQKQLKQRSIQKGFKYQIQKVRTICSKILPEVCQYVYLISFPNALQENQQLRQNRISLSGLLKQFYHQKIISQQWKTQLSFQLSVIFMIELISLFLNEKFSFLKINQVLKSQIYIILIHVFLGIEVGTKAYYLVCKKYKVKNSGHRKNTMKKTMSMQKKPSITLSLKHSQKAMNQLFKNSQKSRALRKFKTKQKISVMSTQNKKSRLQAFTQHLKQNLFVDPLPPLEVKKMSIIQFDRLNAQSREQKLEQVQSMKRISQQMKRKHINSMTISASLDFQLKKKNQVSQNEFLKSSNLSFRPQHHSQHYQNYLNKKSQKYVPIRTQMQHKPAKSKSKKIEPEQWRQIVRRMKANANKPIQLLKDESKNKKINKENNQFEEMIEIKLRKLSSTNNNENINHSIQKKQSLVKSIYQDEVYQTSKKVKTQQNQLNKLPQRSSAIMSLNIMEFTKGGKQSGVQQIKCKIKQKFTQIKGQETQNYQSMLIKSGRIKLKKIQFLKQCQNRSQTIQHTAFQLKHKLA